jgi:hypothetical protein
VTISETENGQVRVALPKLGAGVHVVRAAFVPSDDTMTGSRSSREFVWVLF